ncbi:unnamed protein product, partial [Tenebrio molitor]
MKLLLVLNLLILAVNVQAYTVSYPDRMSDFCYLEDISIEDMIRKIQHGVLLDSHGIKGDLLCFSYKIGLMNDYGEIKEKFIKGVLKRAADEVADICSRDTENLSTIDE